MSFAGSMTTTAPSPYMVYEASIWFNETTTMPSAMSARSGRASTWAPAPVDAYASRLMRERYPPVVGSIAMTSLPACCALVAVELAW